MTATLRRAGLLFVICLFHLSCNEQATPQNAAAPRPAPTQNSPTPSSSAHPTPASTLRLDKITPNTNADWGYADDFTIQGNGFTPLSKLYLNDQEFPPTTIGINSIKFQLPYSLVGAGAIKVSVRNADGQETSLDPGLFLFSWSGWGDMNPLPQGEFLDLTVLNGNTYLALDSGVFLFQGGQWTHIEGQTGCHFPYPEPYCPTCLTPPDPVCSLPISLKPMPGRNDLYALIKHGSCVDCGKIQPNSLFVSHNNSAWQEVNSLSGEPLAIEKTLTTFYALTSQGIFSSSDGSHWETLIHGPFAFDFSSYRLPIRSAPFAVFEDGSLVSVFVGSSYISYNRSTHIASSPHLIGPLLDGCGGGCHQLLPLSVLAVDESSGTLYFAYVPSQPEIPGLGNGGAGKMDIHALASAPTDGPYSLAPWESLTSSASFQKLIPAGSRLFAIGNKYSDTSSPLGWQPVLYSIESSNGLQLFNLPVFDAGLSELPPGVTEEIPFGAYEDGRFYAFLKTRRCLFQSDGVPLAGAFSRPKCLGEEAYLGQSAIQFLFDDSGRLKASTNDRTFELDEAGRTWNSIGPPTDPAQRQDLDYSVLNDFTRLPGWPVDCALKIPELNLSFVCLSDGVHVRYQNGEWSLFRSEDHVLSLSYNSGLKTLFGASAYRGILQMPLP